MISRSLSGDRMTASPGREAAGPVLAGCGESARRGQRRYLSSLGNVAGGRMVQPFWMIFPDGICGQPGRARLSQVQTVLLLPRFPQAPNPLRVKDGAWAGEATGKRRWRAPGRGDHELGNRATNKTASVRHGPACRVSLIDLACCLVAAARPCRAGVPTQSPVAGAPAAPRSGAALI